MTNFYYEKRIIIAKNLEIAKKIGLCYVGIVIYMCITAGTPQVSIASISRTQSYGYIMTNLTII